jgi:hypothetical protein
MRMHIIAATALALAIASPAMAQEWEEFVSIEDGFSINFPGKPTIENTIYKSQFGADLPAKVFRGSRGDSHFSLTVVDYRPIEKILAEKAKGCPPGAEVCRGGLGSTGPGYSWADKAGALIYAAWNFMQRDAKVTEYIWNNIDQVVGAFIHLTNTKDKSRTYAGLFMHEDRLYITEGTVPAGAPEPGIFQQSLGWIDDKGQGIRYRTHYVNGQPKPERGR